MRNEGTTGGRSRGFQLSGGPPAERPDEPTCLVAVEHHGRGLAVPVGAGPDECGLSGGAHVRRCSYTVPSVVPASSRNRVLRRVRQLTDSESNRTRQPLQDSSATPRAEPTRQ
jgi:hypothetical protein